MYRDAFPAARPTGLRSRRLPVGTEFWRIDAEPPTSWTWEGFAAPRHRFDPASGAFRTRYASRSIAGAVRERYLDTGLLIPADHADHHLVRLHAQRALRVVDLRTDANLQALGLDDRISTSHELVVWEAAHLLADAVRAWWPDLDGIAFRSRTTPERSFNLAFFSSDALAADARPLVDCPDELADLVLHHHLTVDFDL